MKATPYALLTVKLSFFDQAQIRESSGIQGLNGTPSIISTSWGRKFPVKNIECTQTQAEHEYRKLDPPIFWYGLYIAGAAIGMLMLASGLKASKTARNYSVKSAYEFTHDDIALGNHSDEGITHYDAIATLEQARLRTENREARRYRPYNRRW